MGSLGEAVSNLDELLSERPTSIRVLEQALRVFSEADRVEHVVKVARQTLGRVGLLRAKLCEDVLSAFQRVVTFAKTPEEADSRAEEVCGFCTPMNGVHMDLHPFHFAGFSEVACQQFVCDTGVRATNSLTFFQ